MSIPVKDCIFFFYLGMFFYLLCWVCIHFRNHICAILQCSCRLVHIHHCCPCTHQCLNQNKCKVFSWYDAVCDVIGIWWCNACRIFVQISCSVLITLSDKLLLKLNEVLMPSMNTYLEPLICKSIKTLGFSLLKKTFH